MKGVKHNELIKKVIPKYGHKLLNRAIAALVFLLVIWWIITYLDSLAHIYVHSFIVKTSNIIFTILITFLVTSLVLRLTSDFVVKLMGDDIEIEYKIFIGNMYGFVLYIIGFLFIFYRFGTSLENITLFLGLVTTGFAFAVRDVILSFLVWAILLTTKPFHIEDIIKIGDEEGKVCKISTFYVTLAPEETDKEVKIPNRLFLEKPITNYGKNVHFSNIKLPITKIPYNWDNRVKKISFIFQKKKISNAEIDVFYEQNMPYLSVTYPVNFKAGKKVKTALMIELAEANRDILFMP